MFGFGRVGVACVVVSALALGGCNGLGLSASEQGVFALAGSTGNTGPAADALELAKEQFRERNFGLAEQGFRTIVEKEADNAEAWLGLAASYDQLRRFDLADRAYGQVLTLNGESVPLINNRAYSYMLRGDKPRARAEFARAQRLDPANAFVKNNLSAL